MNTSLNLLNFLNLLNQNNLQMPNLFALLVGINDYQQNGKTTVPNLTGCVNDINIFEAYLKKRFPEANRKIVKLLEGDATYENVVKNFGPAHLAQAGAGDIVVFAYSGHGSRELAAPEFAQYFPEGMMETLVLADSRWPDRFDLADKELAVLIDRVAQKGAHVAVVLDCCHSGSGTRNLDDLTLGKTRQASDRTQPRQLADYLGGHFAQHPKDFHLPASRHVLLAACDKKEKAHETRNSRGLFSTILMGVLNETQYQQGISYTQLFTEIRLRAAKNTSDQHPQIETYGYFNGLQGFLGMGSPAPDVPVKVFFQDGKWNVTMGAMSGLPTTKAQPATFEILKNGAVVGVAKTVTVGVDESSLHLEFPANENEQYDARLTSTPEPPLFFQLKAEKSEAAAAMKALTVFKPLYFSLQTDFENAAYRLEIGENELKIIRNSDQLCLRTLKGNDWEPMFKDAFEKLEMIARWEKTIQLDNPETKLLVKPGGIFQSLKKDVEMVLSELDANGKVVFQHTGNEATIDILQEEGVENKVPFKLEIRNNAGKPRHCALFFGSSNYRLIKAYNDEVPANSTVNALPPANFKLNNGQPESSIFKLIVSNKPIHPELLEQQNTFKLGETLSFWKSKDVLGVRGDLRGRPRSIDIFDENDDTPPGDLHDWYSVNLKVQCVGSSPGVGEKVISLADNFIKILAHPTFRSGVGLVLVHSGSRNVEPMAVVNELARLSGVELLQFGSGTRDTAPANMLELTDLQNEASLAENPLQLEVSANLQSTDELEESLLPLTFDGEHLIPVGTAERMDNGDALVSISHLPNTTDKQRSLGKALKLCFLKLVLKKKKSCYLRWVDYSGEKAERRSDGLKDKVKAADNILLLLHGIIGDTGGMADCMEPLVQTLEGQKAPFDLVLTFDYENLNTPIEETAGILAEMLKDDADITPVNKKKITIVAHSMGGLVSRYFIENLGGKDLVQHLIMAGTPNGGSNISKITTYRDYAIPVLTLLVNLPWGIPAAASVLGVLQKSKDLTVTLAQIDWDNADFLKNLNKSANPGIRYSIIAGHLENYLQNNADQQKLMDKVYKLGGKLLYGQTPNDIAVSVDSIKTIPKNHHPKVDEFEIACHHLNYFEEKGSVEVLMKLLEIKG